MENNVEVPDLVEKLIIVGQPVVLENKDGVIYIVLEAGAPMENMDEAPNAYDAEAVDIVEQAVENMNDPTNIRDLRIVEKALATMEQMREFINDEKPYAVLQEAGFISHAGPLIFFKYVGLDEAFFSEALFLSTYMHYSSKVYYDNLEIISRKRDVLKRGCNYDLLRRAAPFTYDAMIEYFNLGEVIPQPPPSFDYSRGPNPLGELQDQLPKSRRFISLVNRFLNNM